MLQGSPLGCHHDGKDAFGRFQAPIPASLLHPEQLHFYSGLLHTFHSKGFMATKPLENQ